MVAPPASGSRFVYVDENLGEAKEMQFLDGALTVLTQPAPDKGGANEDAIGVVAVDDRAGALILADGVGGHAGGEHASRITVETLVNTIRNSSAEQLRDAVLDGIEAANRKVLELKTGAAATVSVVELNGATARPYHVGDSLILLTGQRGLVKFQCIPHSPLGYAVESGLINQKDAVHHVERHVVSNVVGTAQMRIDIGPMLKLSARDTLLLASDGLDDNLYMEEIINCVRAGPLLDAAAKLVRNTTARMTEHGHPDDLSFVIFRPSLSRGRARRA